MLEIAGTRWRCEISCNFQRESRHRQAIRRLVLNENPVGSYGVAELAARRTALRGSEKAVARSAWKLTIYTLNLESITRALQLHLLGV